MGEGGRTQPLTTASPGGRQGHLPLADGPWVPGPGSREAGAGGDTTCSRLGLPGEAQGKGGHGIRAQRLLDKQIILACFKNRAAMPGLLRLWASVTGRPQERHQQVGQEADFTLSARCSAQRDKPGSPGGPPLTPVPGAALGSHPRPANGRRHFPNTGSRWPRRASPGPTITAGRGRGLGPEGEAMPVSLPRPGGQAGRSPGGSRNVVE